MRGSGRAENQGLPGPGRGAESITIVLWLMYIRGREVKYPTTWCQPGILVQGNIEVQKCQ